MKVKKLFKAGTRQFIVGIGIFLAILFAVQMFIHLYFRHTLFFIQNLKLEDNFYFISGLQKTDLINALIFTMLIFAIWNRNFFLSMKKYKIKSKEVVIFGVLSFFFLFLHYAYKFWLVKNIDSVSDFIFFFSIIKYLFNLLFVLFLAFAVFSFKQIKFIFLKIWKQIPVFLLILFLYFLLIIFFQSIWFVLSKFVANMISFFLSLNFSNVVLRFSSNNAPIIGVGDFVVGISDACSGIDSLLLFISLMGIIFALDYSRMNWKRMIVLFFIGILGTLFYNILRIYLLILVGVFISPQFAVDSFHSNIGWILFLGFFAIYWHFGSKWVYK